MADVVWTARSEQELYFAVLKQALTLRRGPSTSHIPLHLPLFHLHTVHTRSSVMSRHDKQNKGDPAKLQKSAGKPTIPPTESRSNATSTDASPSSTSSGPASANVTKETQDQLVLLEALAEEAKGIYDQLQGLCATASSDIDPSKVRNTVADISTLTTRFERTSAEFNAVAAALPDGTDVIRQQKALTAFRDASQGVLNLQSRVVEMIEKASVASLRRT